MTNPFGRGPMTGSAMEIAAHLGRPADPAQDDAELVALFAEYQEAEREADRLLDQIDHLIERADASIPVPPLLRVTLPTAPQAALPGYAVRDLVKAIRGEARMSESSGPAEAKAFSDYAEALTATHRGYREAQAQARAALGIPSLQERQEAMLGRYNDIRARIAELPAHSITGIAIKLTIAGVYLGWPEKIKDGESDFADAALATALECAKTLAGLVVP